MPKGRRTKDKMFVSQSEWKEVYGGKRREAAQAVRALPFDSCMISQAPFVTPVGTRAGTIFELRNIVPFVKAHHKDPVTGEPLTGRDLVRLRFHRNPEGKYACPVTMQVFGPRTRILAVATTGNVFAGEAIAAKAGEEAADLLTGKPYDPRPSDAGGDVIVLQDPNDEAAVARRRAAGLHKSDAPTEAEAAAPDATAEAAGSATAAGAEPDAVAAAARAAAEASASAVRLTGLARRAHLAAAAAPRPEDPTARSARRRRDEEAALRSANGGMGAGSAAGIGGRRFRTRADGWEPPELPRAVADAVASLKSSRGSGVAVGSAPRAAGSVADCAGGSHVADVDDLYDEADRRRFRAELAAARARGEGARMEMLMTSSGGTSASFTSSAVSGPAGRRLGAPPRSKLRQLRWRRVASLRSDALVSLTVTIAGREAGRLRFELRCGVAPMACDNFLQLARRGAYDGTPFHRSVRNFMVQGGDPEGTGRGGASAWGGVFPNEADTSRARHDQRGCLSMANSGPHTNGSQFFVLLKPASHLDSKHTVFGRLVGGADTLRAIELVETDPKTDRPRREVAVSKVEIHRDPFWDDATAGWGEAEPDAAQTDRAGKRAAPGAGVAGGAPTPAAGAAPGGVGKYLRLAGPAAKRPRPADA